MNSNQMLRSLGLVMAIDGSILTCFGRSYHRFISGFMELTEMSSRVLRQINGYH